MQESFASKLLKVVWEQPFCEQSRLIDNFYETKQKPWRGNYFDRINNLGIAFAWPSHAISN